MTTLVDLRDNLSGPSAEYKAKQLHPVPDFPMVDRNKFIVERCKGKRVLDIGASGLLYEQIHAVASVHWGIDHPSNDNNKPRPGVFYVDLDSHLSILPNREIDLVVCGEVIEHLTNPGRFLDQLRSEYSCPVIITVPNALSDAGLHWMKRGIENVNLDHTCWYSYWTLRGLLGKHRFKIDEFYWYNGRPRFAEGMIAVAVAEQ